MSRRRGGRLHRRVTLNPWVLLRPVCWLLDHDAWFVQGGTWADRSGWECKRCLKWVR